MGLEDFVTPGVVCQIGLPPRRIDVTTIIDGVAFDEAWAGRLEGSLGDVRLSYIGREALVRNKEAVGRAKDLATSRRAGPRASSKAGESLAADPRRTHRATRVLAGALS